MRKLQSNCHGKRMPKTENISKWNMFVSIEYALNAFVYEKAYDFDSHLFAPKPWTKTKAGPLFPANW